MKVKRIIVGLISTFLCGASSYGLMGHLQLLLQKRWQRLDENQFQLVRQWSEQRFLPRLGNRTIELSLLNTPEGDKLVEGPLGKSGWLTLGARKAEVRDLTVKASPSQAHVFHELHPALELCVQSAVLAVMASVTGWIAFKSATSIAS